MSDAQAGETTGVRAGSPLGPLLRRPVTAIAFPLALVAGAGLRSAELGGNGLRSAAEVAGLLLGLFLLAIGSDCMVKGAVRVARRLGVSPFVIGVTVVAFGTSAPELVTSVTASLKGDGEIAVGNVVGSNIANLCLILGATAVVRPVRAKASVIKYDLPLMIVLSAAASLTMLDAWYPGRAAGEPTVIGRIDGLLLVLGLGGYIAYNALAGRIDPAEIESDLEGEPPREDAPGAGAAATGMLGNLALVALGVVGLALGADLLVESAKSIAGRLGVPDVVIALTAVAIGTSLPELALSLRAAMHGHADIAVGNVLGSNVFNLLSVLGVAALVRPIDVPQLAVSRDLWVMLGVSALAWPLMWTCRSLGRMEGTGLLVVYALYLGWVAATGRPPVEG